MPPLWRVLDSPQGRNNPGKLGPEVGEDLSDVVAAGALDGEDGVANYAFQGAS